MTPDCRSAKYDRVFGISVITIIVGVTLLAAAAYLIQGLGAAILVIGASVTLYGFVLLIAVAEKAR